MDEYGDDIRKAGSCKATTILLLDLRPSAGYPSDKLINNTKTMGPFHDFLVLFLPWETRRLSYKEGFYNPTVFTTGDSGRSVIKS